MPTLHSIELDEITFDDGGAAPADRLKFPFYGNLLDPQVVTAEKRQFLQLEPAFQFLAEGDTDVYEFRLKLAGEGVFFARGGDGAPIVREAAGGARPGITGAFFAEEDPSLRTCVIRVEPASWGASRVVCLRIFCNQEFGSAAYDPSHGVSLSFVGPGADTAASGSGLVHPLVGSALEVSVTVAQSAGRAIPYYSIFRPFLLPPSLDLEPALRVSAEKPAASLKLVLTNQDLRFKSAAGGEDEVEVMLRAGAADRPSELSLVKSNAEKKTVQFTWQRSRSRSFLSFGFSLRVEGAAPGFGTSGFGNGGPIDIDPILFNDPPPGGL